MHDGGKILVGLVLFLGLMLVPFWTNAFQQAPKPPEPKIVVVGKTCVAPKEVMRETHMQVLNEWRDSVVRGGKRTYVTDSGERVTMSLSGTCMDCHSNKADFCDACHNYVAVQPYCWDCHIEPGEKP